MNVKQRAEAVGTFRHVNVFLMETLARWVPSTPEMEAKILMGRHLWLLAQIADKLGRRSRELRAPLHYDVAPAAGYVQALAALAAVQSTADRLGAFYGPVLDSVGAAYDRYLRETDVLIDEPSVVILDEGRRDVQRMRADQQALLEEFPALRQATAALPSLASLFCDPAGMVASAQLQPA